MLNRGEVYFGLKGQDFDPDQATKIIGLAPTSVRFKGKIGTPIYVKYSSWKYSSGEIEHAYIDVYKMSSDLVSILTPYKEKLKFAKLELGLIATFQIVLRISTDDSMSTPAIGFDSTCIEFINAIGAEIDIDTYLLPRTGND